MSTHLPASTTAYQYVPVLSGDKASLSCSAPKRVKGSVSPGLVSAPPTAYPALLSDICLCIIAGLWTLWSPWR